MEPLFREIKKCIFLVVQWRIQAGAQQVHAPHLNLDLQCFYLFLFVSRFVSESSKYGSDSMREHLKP